jgi:hypothetical protein
MTFMKKHKNDILLVLAVLILGGVFLAYTEFFRPEGGEVIVSVDGVEQYALPLSENNFVVIGDEENYNLLVISGGEAYIEEASCPDNICVKSGKVSLEGQTIVCLPYKVVISIEGGKSSGLDGVAG